MRVVRIAELKTRLSEYLRAVRRGHEVTVLDRETPVARIVPYGRGQEPLVVRTPLRTAPGLQQVPLPPPLPIEADVVSLLLEERQGGR
ncbi:MAG: type II toxin-antitoxin system prevent-host-death family antitoxin [Candidatus Rokubacteria bacterium]|nr:type II toxin-antitoxin system prevent-host-death family antitoxin [Candidatus Rokubacteria bacterium]